MASQQSIKAYADTERARNYARIHLAGTQSNLGAGFELVTYDTKDYADDDTILTLGSSSITPSIAGTYFIHAQTFYSSGIASGIQYGIKILKDSTTMAEATHHSGQTGAISVSVSAAIVLNGSEVITVQGFSSNGAGDISGGINKNFLELFRIW